MKKHMFILCLLFVCCAAVNGQTQAVFTKKFGLNAESSGTCTIRTSDGGYMLCGNSGGANSYGLGRILIIKTDADCNVQWTRNYGGNLPEYVSAIIQNPDGSYTMTGTTYSYNSQPYGDAFLMKISSTGTLMWCKIYTGSDSEYSYDLVRLPNGDYVFSGLTRTSTSGGYDCYAVRTDSAGTPVWMTKFGGIGNDEIQSMAIAADGNIMLLGSGYIGTDGGMLLAKLNVTNGALLWTKVYGNGPGGNGRGSDLVKTTSGSYYLVGWEYGGNNVNNIYVVKTDNNGTPLWSKSYGTPYGDLAYDGALTSDGGLVITGSADSIGTGQDIFLLRIDSAGAMQWTTSFGSPGYQNGAYVLEAYDGGFLISGSSTVAFFSGVVDWYVIKTDAAGNSGCQQNPASFSVLPDSLVWATVNPFTGTPFGSSTSAFNTSLGLTDTTLCSTVGIADVVYSGLPFMLYPNPNEGSGVTLQLQGLQQDAAQVRIVNMAGQTCYMHVLKNETVLAIETAAFAPGLYIVEVQDGNAVSRQKLIIR